MKNVFYIFILFWVSNCFSQNWKDVTSDYIVNPSFELYDTCPFTFSQPWDYQINNCLGWTTPTYATSDYFNSCSSNNIVGVPLNFPGWQNAFDGNAYLGFLGYGGDWYIDSVNVGWYEYLQSKLLKKLEVNTKYKFSMRVSRADFSGSISHKNIGANFSSNSLQDYTTTKPYNILPSVINEANFIDDTATWTLVCGEFLAQGNENYLTIGWFGNNYIDDFAITQNIYIDSITSDTSFISESYYFIDSLKLYIQESNIEHFNINIFTPNSDGFNDFIDFKNYNLNSLEFTVYNRWGELLFASKDINLKWEGTNNSGEFLKNGTYYYILKATTSNNKIITIRNYISIYY